METLKTAIQWTARKTEQKIAQKLANSAAKSADRICIAGHRGVSKFFSFDLMNAEPVGSAFFVEKYSARSCRPTSKLASAATLASAFFLLQSFNGSAAFGAEPANFKYSNWR